MSIFSLIFLVPIRDKPQFNLKRRSVYLEGSNYATIGSNTTGVTQLSANNSLTKSSISTFNSQQHSPNSGVNGLNGLTTSASSCNLSASASLRSRSMPKLDNNNNNMNKQQQQNVPTVVNGSSITQNTMINSGSSSPTSRSRSISSDDHGIGSASLSQLSGSPNIEYVYPRKRLYASIPDRKFICIKSYKPAQAGELELKKGDIVEILSVGEGGYWEGRSSNNEGWFPSDCVEEIQLPKGYYLNFLYFFFKLTYLFDFFNR